MLNEQIFHYWAYQTLAMMITALILPSLRVTNLMGALLMVLALAGVNATIWDAALFYNVPNTVNNQTALLLISNGILFWVLVKLLPGIEMDGFLGALLAPIIFTVTSMFIHNHIQGIALTELYYSTIKTIERLRENLLRMHN